ncbi:MAG: pilus assembly protein PilM, partial [Parcubacteria group bacterium]|nr:pilus assembly protein PilM [Parcubacteria group bacterium]
MVLNGNKNTFGLDICDDSAKVVQLKQQRTFRGKSRLLLSSYGEIRLPKGIIRNGEILSLEKLSPYISELLKKTKIKSKKVVVSLPEKKSFLHLLEINARNEKNLEEGLPRIIESHLPVSYKEIYADWQIISKKDEGGDLIRYKVLFGAVLRKTSDSITELLKSLDLLPVALEIEGVALSRSALRLEPETKSKNYAIVDIGSTSSNIIFTQDSTPTLSLDIPVSGNAITKTIADSLKLSVEAAEKTKLKCGLDLKLCEGKLRPVLSYIITDVTQKIQKAIKF